MNKVKENTLKFLAFFLLVFVILATLLIFSSNVQTAGKFSYPDENLKPPEKPTVFCSTQDECVLIEGPL